MKGDKGLGYINSQIEINYGLIVNKNIIALYLILLHIIFYFIWTYILDYDWDSIYVRLVAILLAVPFFFEEKLKNHKLFLNWLFYINIIYEGGFFPSFITVSSNYIDFWSMALFGMTPILVLFVHGVFLTVASYMFTVVFLLVLERTIGTWEVKNIEFILFKFATLSSFQYFCYYYLKDMVIKNFTKINEDKVLENYFLNKAKPNLESEPKITGLTERENEVFELIIKGYSSKEISDLLFSSEGNIRFHSKNIRDKLGFKTTLELMSHYSNKG